MKSLIRAIFLTAILVLSVSPLAFAKPAAWEHITEGDFILYFPSFRELTSTAQSLMRRFYGRNYLQMLEEMKLQSQSLYGVDIFSEQSLRDIGVNISGSVAYVNISNDVGYLLIPIESQSKFRNYVRTKLGDTLPYYFAGNFAILSASETAVKNISKKAVDNESFAIAMSRLNYQWGKPVIWIKSSYFSRVAGGSSVSSQMNLPQGFTAAVIDFKENEIGLDTYSGVVSDRQKQFVRTMRQVSGQGRFDMLDYIWGNPSAMGNIYLNFARVYDYYRQIDRMNILGIQSVISDMRRRYQVNIERDLINNCDGRFKFVVQEFNQETHSYDIFGSIGVRNRDVARTLMESLKAATLKSGSQLFTFEIFTNPFYHYKTTNYSVFFGLVEEDFIFATDKDTLTQLVKNIYENQNGFLAQTPGFFKNASTNRDIGYYFIIDVQSLFSNIKTSGLQISSEFLVGIKDIHIYGEPEGGTDAYGWKTSAKINFHKK
jgi:hypothetical protein